MLYRKRPTTAYCLLPTAYCLVPTSWCLLLSAYCLPTLTLPCDKQPRRIFCSTVAWAILFRSREWTMAGRSILGGKVGWLAIAIVAAALGLFWFAGTPLLTWYYLRGLAHAKEEDREGWVKRLVLLDWAAVPGLMNCLRQEDERICDGSAAALTALIDQWPQEDVRRLELAQLLEGAFAQCSAPGQRAALELATLFLKGDPPDRTPDLIGALQRLLTVAARVSEPGHRLRSLALAALLLPLTPRDTDWEVYRELAQFGLQDTEVSNRHSAVRLTLHPAVRADQRLLQGVLPLIHDPSAMVRRVALLSIGSEEELLNEDDLLPLLHDPDEEVRRLCEGALRGRGLKETHIHLGRLLTDAHPRNRLDVLQHLHEADDLRPELWLQRLSQDKSAAVRAGAIRYAFDAAIDLQERVRQMSQTDPDATVRQNARDLLELQGRKRR
jgi:hypothetical protein